MRVHELARELQIESKELMEHIAEMGIAVKTHSSGLTDEQVAAIRAKLQTPGHRKPAPKKEAPARQHAEPAAVPAAAVPEETLKGDLVERRISGTVIRRRKKAEPEPLPPEQLEAEPAAAPEPSAAVPETADAELPAAQDTPAAPAVTIPETAPAEQGGGVAAAERKAAEKPPEERQVKKLRLKEKESTPARIIDRIDLGPKKEPEKPAEPPGVKEVPGQAPKEGEETADRDKKGFFKEKEKGSRKKFRWQQELGDEEEQEKEAVPYAPQRIRYKIKDKPHVRVRRHRGEVVPLAQRKETEKTVPKAIKRKIKLQEGISVGDLAKRMGIKATEIIKKLIDLGSMATVNQLLDTDTATLVAADFGYEIESVSIEEETVFDEQVQEVSENLQGRCPVVTVMGHVDHGKTTLLDAIRKTNVAEGEKGGITQHIGAYRVAIKSGEITFIDTPGHEAFTTMRARGAKVTDIVILVVAAEEGVKPQTIEAINHAKAAGVPIVVAINKVDKPDANPEKVRQELSNYGLLSEDWGGETIFVNVSAKKNQGVDKLLEMVLLQAEMLELKANPNRQARGIIIEARLDRGRGPIATILVQEGTLHVGDSFVSRHNFGKVRALIGDTGAAIHEAGPATPVEVIGFASVPEAGDKFIVIDEKKARQTSIYWQQKRRAEDLRKDARVSLENFFSTIAEADSKELRLIIKADVQGSLEALKQSLEPLSTEEIKVQVIHNSVGSISLNDVMLASASNAIIIGFGVKTEPKVEDTADQEQVDIRLYNIIYDVIDDVKKAMSGMLAPKLVEKLSGKAEVRQLFAVSKTGTVAGCFVVEGRMLSGSKARVLRGTDIIYEGSIASLKRFKDDAREVLAGQDCGIFLNEFKEFAVGDIVESFTQEEVQRKL